jgi:hypothetical protein
MKCLEGLFRTAVAMVIVVLTSQVLVNKKANIMKSHVSCNAVFVFSYVRSVNSFDNMG